MAASDRAGEVLAATRSHWGRGGHATLERPHGDGLLVVDREPEPIYGPGGELVGVDAWVRAYRADGRERRIDPHRRVINPPTVHAGEADPVEAFYAAVTDSVLGTPHPRGWTRRRDRGTVTTVFAGTGDGQIGSADSSYGAARTTGATFLTPNTASSVIRIGQLHASSTFRCYEGFLSFDTTAIPDTDDVTDVDLDIYVITDASTGADFGISCYERAWTAGGLTAADWVNGDNLIDTAQLTFSESTSGLATGAYKTLGGASGFLTATNMKTGTVAMVLFSDRQFTASQPVNDTNEYIEFSSADETGTTQDPKLTITHAGTAAAPPMFTSRPPHVWKVY